MNALFQPQHGGPYQRQANLLHFASISQQKEAATILARQGAKGVAVKFGRFLTFTSEETAENAAKVLETH